MNPSAVNYEITSCDSSSENQEFDLHILQIGAETLKVLKVDNSKSIVILILDILLPCFK